MYQSISCIEFLLFSFRLFYLSVRFLCLLTCLSLEFFIYLFFVCLPFCFGVSVFVLFRVLWILVTVNKAKFSLRKALITLSKTPSLVWMLFTVYKIYIIIVFIIATFRRQLIYRLISPPISTSIIFSEALDISCFHTRILKL